MPNLPKRCNQKSDIDACSSQSKIYFGVTEGKMGILSQGYFLAHLCFPYIDGIESFEIKQFIIKPNEKKILFSNDLVKILCFEFSELNSYINILISQKREVENLNPITPQFETQLEDPSIVNGNWIELSGPNILTNYRGIVDCIAWNTTDSDIKFKALILK
jgi:hypothetical protein